MKKILTVLSIAFCIAVIAPSCASSDEGFEEIVLNSNLDQTVPSNGNESPDPAPGPGGD